MDQQPLFPATGSPLSEQQFAALFEFASVGMALLDTQSRALRVNPAMCRLLGRTEQELMGASPHDVGHPEDAAREAELRSLMVTGAFPSYQLEKRYRHADGHLFWSHQTCTLVRDGQGLPANFIVQVQDLSEHRAAEAALRASEERFRATFEQAALGIAHIGLDGRILRVNRRLCEMHGYSRDELVRLHAQALTAKESQAASDADLRRLLDGQISSYTGERRFVRGDGQTYPARISVSLVRGEGEPYLISFVEDMSQHEADQRRIGEQAQELQALNAMLEDRIRERTLQLQESNDELRTFAYSLAHDLRAPLAAIDGFSHELERRLQQRLDAESRHYLGRVRAGVQQMSDLTDAMLSLTALSQAELVRQSVDLSVAAQGWLHRMRGQQPERQVDVHIAPTPRTEGDVRLLTDLLENLLGNAWKFTARREEARIEFGAQAGEGGQPVYFVRDNGAGFDMAYAGKLFGPFQRLHGADEFPGTGIGLAIVRKIALLHGGRVWAESVEGQGATFYFTLGEPGG